MSHGSKARGVGATQLEHERKWDRFIDEYIKNGGNASQAAVSAGFTSKNSRITGSRVLNNPYVQGKLAARAKEMSEASGLDAARTLREVARLAYADPGDLFDPDGRLKPLHEMSASVRATIAQIDIVETYDGDEKEPLRIVTKKIRLWDKNAALEKAMKHHGLYLRDNEQRNDVIQNLIVTANNTLDAKLQRLITNSVPAVKE